MRFWDSSAIVALLVTEARTDAIQTLHRDDPLMLVWWATEVECMSALARLERESLLVRPKVRAAVARLDALKNSWHEIEPVDAARSAARRLLRVHRLRAADALQLAAAILACEGEPSSLEVVTLDERLGDAAEREGFGVIQAEA